MRWFLLVCTCLWLTACANTLEEEATTVNDPLGAAKTRLSLGLSYLQAGNFSQAKFNLDRALSFAPRFADAHYGMAFYYQQVGEVAQAREAYDTALGLAPNDPEISNSYGAFLCTQGQFDEAEQLFLKAVSSRDYVSSAQTYENAAICQQTKGDITQAIFYLKKSLNHQPRRASVLALLAELQTSQQQYADAKRTLNRLESVSGVTADSVYLRYQIAQFEGDTVRQRDYANMLQARFPQHPNAQKVILDAEIIASGGVPKVQPSEAKPAAKASSTTEQHSEKRSPLVHVLQKGETLYRLSVRYQVSVADLITWNKLTNATNLSVGQRIIVSQP